MMLSAGNGFIMQSEKYSRDNAGQSLKKYTLLKKGELAYNHGASKAKQFGCCYQLEVDEALVPFVYHCFSVNKEYAPYVSTVLNISTTERQLKKLVSSSVRMDGLLNISYDDYMTVELALPSMDEQQKVSCFLSLLEEKIKKQQQLVEHLKKYKRGLLSFVFKDCSSWEVKPLGNLCRIRTGKLDANAMVADGIYPFFTCARESYKIDTYAFDCDALLVSGNGANVGYIHHYCGKFNAYQRTYVLDGFNENIKYIQYFLEAFLSSRIDSEKKAGNTPYIVLGTLSEMDIFIPSMETQENIATMLTSIDRRINLEEQHYSHLTAIHKGIMQSIFI